MRALPVAIAVLCLAASPLPQARAADAHIGVHPEKGEMVLLRDVSPRAAYRPAPPGIALIVDPKPNREIHGSLGTGELSDDDIAMMSSGRLDASGRPASLPEQMVGRALQGTVGGSAGNGGIVSGAGIASGIGGVTGAIGGATRSIAPTITGALSQFPVGGTPGTGP